MIGYEMKKFKVEYCDEKEDHVWDIKHGEVIIETETYDEVFYEFRLIKPYSGSNADIYQIFDISGEWDRLVYKYNLGTIIE